jgi:rubredoxin
VEEVKPPASHVILEMDVLTETLQENCHCPQCHRPVDVSFKSICIASSIKITCRKECGYIYHSASPAKADIGAVDKIECERSNDFAINILYVLGFISSGNGGVEASRLLGLLGLLNKTTIETKSSPTIEEWISPKLQELTRQILLENLVEEVRLFFHDSPKYHVTNFEVWERCFKDESVVVPQSKYARISVSFDMGWQQRSSGNRYASLSGDALLVGGRTRKLTAMVIESKLCNFCRASLEEEHK